MGVADIDLQTREIFIGSTLLTICTLFYLAWWIAAFRPDTAHKTSVSAVLLCLAFIAGGIGVALLIVGIHSIPYSKLLMPKVYIICGGIIVYFILLLLTHLIFRRQVTTELALIVGWAILEISVINVLYGAAVFRPGTAVTFIVLTAAVAVLSLVCYLLYYNLDKNTGFIDGMIPLIAGAVEMAAFSLVIII